MGAPALTLQVGYRTDSHTLFSSTQNTRLRFVRAAAGRASDRVLYGSRISIKLEEKCKTPRRVTAV